MKTEDIYSRFLSIILFSYHHYFIL